MAQIAIAKEGKYSPELLIVAKQEGVDKELLRKSVAQGTSVIMKSKSHDILPLGIGAGLSIKINANIGTSKECDSIESELKKLEAVIKHGSHAVMDLSTGKNPSQVRQKLLKASKIAFGTVPIYDVIADAGDINDVTAQDFVNAVKSHINSGVDFVTIHSGLTRSSLPLLKNRIMGVVSRGGSYLTHWMIETGNENPLYESFDEIAELARDNDVVLSLGDGLRPGCIADATDEAQLSELKVLGELVLRSRKIGAMSIVEGPGHIPLNDIEKNMKLEKELCHGAAFYVLGPLVTDRAAGYDHIAGAIGAAVAGMHGADFLCYLTPKEHLGLPDINDCIEGVIASRIAAHAGDIARKNPRAQEEDRQMAIARSKLDWEGMFSNSIAPEKAKSLRDSENEECSMCGTHCSAKLHKSLKDRYNQY